MPIPRRSGLLRSLAIATSSAVVIGCSSTSSPLVGTWQGRGPAADAPFSFGAVTFAPDGTFTAEANYGDTTRAVSGRYDLEGATVTLEGREMPARSYTVEAGADTAVFTDPTSGRSMTLDRFR